MSTSSVQSIPETGPLRSARRVLASTVKGILKSPRGVQLLVVCADVLMLVFSFTAFYAVRVKSGLFLFAPDVPLADFLQPTAMVLIAWLSLFWFSGVYISVHNRSLFDEFYAVLKVIVIGWVVFFIAIYLTSSHNPDGISYRMISLLIYLVLLVGAIGFGRFMVRLVVRRLRKRGIGLRRTIVVGDSPKSRQLVEMFTKHPELGYAVLGTVAVSNSVTPEFASRLLGRIENIDQIIAARRVDVTVLGMELQREMVPKLLTETAVADTTIKIIPDLYDIVSGQAKAQHLYGIPLIEINPQIMPVWEQHLKRAMDIVCAVVGLVLGAPLWMSAALAVKLEDGGPVFYSQERVGLGGRPFMMHKFRSMRIDAESKGISWTTANDPRVTRVGRFIRRTHIDELPQLWNVLVGEMSLVGPRPERPFYVEKYSKVLPSYPRRLRVKPGLTGWNQVQLEDMVENVEFVQERLRHDFFYIENMSLRLDIEIIFRTILRVLQRKGQA
ncbi:MAG: sugar transferase [Bacteroidetes bacterium]|nr:sugar transferase [Bacteroidota bacterium]